MLNVTDSILAQMSARRLQEATTRVDIKERRLRAAQQDLSVAENKVTSAKQEVSKAQQNLTLLNTINTISNAPSVAYDKINNLMDTAVGLNIDTYA